MEAARYHGCAIAPNVERPDRAGANQFRFIFTPLFPIVRPKKPETNKQQTDGRPSFGGCEEAPRACALIVAYSSANAPRSQQRGRINSGAKTEREGVPQRTDVSRSVRESVV